jgi:hypothetical protein
VPVPLPTAIGCVSKRFSTRRGRAANCVGSHDSGRESTHHCGAASEFASLGSYPNNQECVAYERNIADRRATRCASTLSPPLSPATRSRLALIGDSQLTRRPPRRAAEKPNQTPIRFRCCQGRRQWPRHQFRSTHEGGGGIAPPPHRSDV